MHIHGRKAMNAIVQHAYTHTHIYAHKHTHTHTHTHTLTHTHAHAHTHTTCQHYKNEGNRVVNEARKIKAHAN